MSGFEESLGEKKIITHIGQMEMRNTLQKKVYLDYLIKHKIFTHDDIYKNTFKSDRVFDELKEKFAQYRKLYIKEKGTSP
jgi:hypothetical protein